MIKIPTYHKMLAISDVTLLVSPSIEERKKVIVNMVDALHVFGVKNPNIGLLSLIEKPAFHMKDTVEAQTILIDHQDEPIAECNLVGPITWDLMLNKEAARQGICQDILLEVNIAGEESKSGFAEEDIHPLLEKIGDFPAIRVRGLMAIPPICQISTENHKFFQKIYNLSVDITAKKYDNVCVDILSMGMSGDYADAIACGSTMIRVGTAIFGPRHY
jgi:hypothetical protein